MRIQLSEVGGVHGEGRAEWRRGAQSFLQGAATTGKSLSPFYPPTSPFHLPFQLPYPTALTVDLTGREGGCGQARGTVGGQRRARARPRWRPVIRVHGQLVPKRFFLAPVGKPVVDTHLRDKVGA